MRLIPNVYAGSRLDRVSALRRDESWIAARLGAAGAWIVPVWRARNLIDGDPAAPRAGLLPATDWTGGNGTGDADLTLLGIDGDTTFFAADLSGLETPENHPLLHGRGQFVDLRAVAPLLPRDDACVLACARGLMWWHGRHRFCGVCGHPTESREAGHVRACTDPACAALHFPRTDPAVIMLVHDGDRCLLGRQSRFAPGMYSTLAGFVEPGESLEEAVAREVFEEAGVRVAWARYHSSQPWPFPSSIMLGFHARAATTDIRIDGVEMEDARWFSRDWVRETRDHDRDDGRFRLPRTDSIARRLIEDWLDGNV